MQRIAEKPSNRGLIKSTCLTTVGIVFGFMAALAGCDVAKEATATAEPEPPRTLLCGDRGRLETELIGAFTGTLDWAAEELECTGMPRPDGEGARLRFAGEVNTDDRRVAVIIGIPDLERGVTARELRSNVTLLVEGSGKFFSTSSLEACWTDVTTQDPVHASADQYVVAGTLYCVAPLAEINGESSLSIPELAFTGLLDWSGK